TEGIRGRSSLPVQDADLKFNQGERQQSHSLKFGTRMPESIDLRAAIEVCETLCKFAIHYSGNSQHQHAKSIHPSVLNEQERANLLAIRSMNMKMLTGFRNGPRASDNDQANPSTAAAAAAASTMGSEPTASNDNCSKHNNEASHKPHSTDDFTPSEQASGPKPTGTTSYTDGLRGGIPPNNEPSLQFGPGPPSDDLTHEMAKAANSMVQLAVRIKAWVNMTPEERMLDEEINIIRGRRSLVMEDQGGGGILGQSTVSSWVPVSTSLKSFAERIGPLEGSTTNLGPPSDARDGQDRSTRGGGGGGGGSGYLGGAGNHSHSSTLAESDGGRVAAPVPSASSSSSQAYGSASNGAMTIGSSNSSSGLMAPGSFHSQASGAGASGTGMPYQKYKKRAKRMQPPGRCQSCNSSDTPEWRRGPDGARTLCNACGLHYAKLVKRQQHQLRMNREGNSSSVPQITFPLRPPQAGLLTDGQGQSQQANEDSGHRQSSSSPSPSLGDPADNEDGADAQDLQEHFEERWMILSSSSTSGHGTKDTNEDALPAREAAVLSGVTTMKPAPVTQSAGEHQQQHQPHSPPSQPLPQLSDSPSRVRSSSNDISDPLAPTKSEVVRLRRKTKVLMRL
ncbi:hypothetical protein DFQ27_003226, partial [Actinomortierella ambigua]